MTTKRVLTFTITRDPETHPFVKDFAWDQLSKEDQADLLVDELYAERLQLVSDEQVES